MSAVLRLCGCAQDDLFKTFAMLQNRFWVQPRFRCESLQAVGRFDRFFFSFKSEKAASVKATWCGLFVHTPSIKYITKSTHYGWKKTKCIKNNKKQWAGEILALWDRCDQPKRLLNQCAFLIIRFRSFRHIELSFGMSKWLFADSICAVALFKHVQALFNILWLLLHSAWYWLSG